MLMRNETSVIKEDRFKLSCNKIYDVYKINQGLEWNEGRYRTDEQEIREKMRKKEQQDQINRQNEEF